MKHQQTREELYNSLESRIGRTPLVKYAGEVANGNSIWIKRECDNLFGSHYDRVYLALFKHFEELETIKQGDKVLETTSGTAGYSFAGIGKLLGYDCHVVIPEGVDHAIIQLIKSKDATLYFTPEQDYIAGFPAFLKDFLPQHKKDFTFLNHSMGLRNGPAFTNNEVTLAALEEIGEEICTQINVDYFIPAVGNGSSILGPARAFPESTKIVAFESAQSAVAYDMKYPERYYREFGIQPGVLPRHKMRGTSFRGIDFPHIKTAIAQGIIDDVCLVSDKEIDKNYFQLTGRNDTSCLPHWDMELEHCADLGRSSRAGIAVALQIARNINEKNLVIIGYDTIDRYDLWKL